MRAWPGLAALGAGLIHLGSAVGTAPGVLVPLVFIGIAEVLWGTLALSRSFPPFAAPAAAVLGVLLVGTVVALLLPPAAARHGATVSFGVPAGAFAGAGALDLAVAVLLAVHLGRGRPEAGPARPARFLITAGAAAAVIAIVTTKSLAATSVGGSMTMH